MEAHPEPVVPAQLGVTGDRASEAGPPESGTGEIFCFPHFLQMEIVNAGEKRGNVAILFPTQVENTQAGEGNIVPGNRGRQPEGQCMKLPELRENFCTWGGVRNLDLMILS